MLRPRRENCKAAPAPCVAFLTAVCNVAAGERELISSVAVMTDKNDPTTQTVAAALNALNELAEKEYHTSLGETFKDQGKDVALLRLARLAGIGLKEQFAVPRTLEVASRPTGAYREWRLQDELRTAPDFGALMQTDAYRLQQEIYKEITGAESVPPAEVAEFIRSSHNESNWFLNLVKVVRPYLCEKRTDIWDVVQRTGDKVSFMAGTGLTPEYIAPVMKGVLGAVPWLHFAAPVATTGLVLLAMHYGKKAFCETVIEPEFITLFNRDVDFEKK